MIFVASSEGKGRGVFARTNIPQGALIEEAPVVVIPAGEVQHLDKTILGDYYFLWGPEETEAALFLGLCSLCNHSFQPNAVFLLNLERRTIAFFALREICSGDEITANYNGDPSSPKAIWFPLRP
jgi:SET domain-containing protein